MRLTTLLIVALPAIVACEPASTSNRNTAVRKPPPSPEEIANALAAKEQAALLSDCRSNINPKLASYNALMKNRAYWAASLELRRCADALNDPRLKSLVATSEIKSHIQDIESPRISDFDRLRAIEMLDRDYPEEAKKYESLRKRLTTNARRKSEQAQRQHYYSEIEDKARKRAEAPSVSATASDINHLTTYAVMLGRGIGCGVDTNDASKRIGAWMDRTFPPGSEDQRTYLPIFISGVQFHTDQQRTGKSPDSCRSVLQSFKAFPWP